MLEADNDISNNTLNHERWSALVGAVHTFYFEICLKYEDESNEELAS